MAVTDHAILSIREMILSGRLAPGDRLPPEAELSAELGLSRNSLREAVKALELIRVLDVRRGDGTYVTSLEPSILMEAMAFVVDLHQDHSLLEAFEVRRLLEPAASALAAATITDDAVAELRALVHEVDEHTGVEALVAHDLRFHRTILEQTRNDYLVNLLDVLSSQTVRARVWRGLTEEESVARTLAEHGQIVDALSRRDAELVRSLVTVHVSGVEHWIRRSTQ